VQELGASDHDFGMGLLGQIIAASSIDGELDHDQFRMTLSYIEGMEPQDPVHAVMGLQMMAVHQHFMKFSKRLDRSKTQPEVVTYGRLVASLARTYGGQAEVHKRYGRASKPGVKVQNLSVQDGRRAIVGNVMQHSGVALPNQAVPAPLALPDANAAPTRRASKRQRRRIPRARLKKDE
jgi:hypothetical protein